MRYKSPWSLEYQSEKLEAIRKIIHRELVLKSQLSHTSEHRQVPEPLSSRHGKLCQRAKKRRKSEPTSFEKHTFPRTGDSGYYFLGVRLEMERDLLFHFKPV